MVATKILNVKGVGNLKRALNYIVSDAKTVKDIPEEFIQNEEYSFEEVITIDGEISHQLVSGYGVIDPLDAAEEMLFTKKLAEQKKGNKDLSDFNKKDAIFAKHIIQSFSPDDNLSPEEIHEIGRQTALQFTSAHHEFVIATHTDKGHIHNHIIFNTTDSVTLNKYHQYKDTDTLKYISDKISKEHGAYIIPEGMKNSHKKYSAYQRKNIHKIEIKQRLNFLLKHSLNLEDFQEKAAAMNLFVDFNGKYAKYRLLDNESKRNTRDDSISKKRIYSKEKIEESLKVNDLVYEVDEIFEKYLQEQEEKEEDFETKILVEAWQVERESDKGIYITLDYGENNSGTVLIPASKVDKLENDDYHIFIKRRDNFYFLRPDSSEEKRFIRGETLARQLSRENGSIPIQKNHKISELDQLVAEFNFLNSYHVNDGNQFEHLLEEFDQQAQEIDETLDKINMKINKQEQVIELLKNYESGSFSEKQEAVELLNKWKIDPSTSIHELKKQLQEFEQEYDSLNSRFEEVKAALKFAKGMDNKKRNEEKEKDNIK